MWSNPGRFLNDKSRLLKQYFKAVWTLPAFLAENSDLKKENVELLGKLANLEKLERENELFRRQLNLAQRERSELLLVKVVALNRNTLNSTILINRGSNDGLTENMAVISGGNVMMGVVKEVFVKSALVWLADDPRLSIGVRIGNQGVLGIAKNSSGNFGVTDINLVTNKDPVEENDLIVTNGLDGLPETLIIGRVEKITLRGGNLFKEVKARLSYDFSQGSDLLVILR